MRESSTLSALVSKYSYYYRFFGCFHNYSVSTLPAFLLCSPVCHLRTMTGSYEARQAIGMEGQSHKTGFIVGCN